LKVLWKFGDGEDSGWLENCLTDGDCDAKHSYSSSGTQTILLTAQEMVRGQEAYDYRNVYVYDEGLNVFAIISSPGPITEQRVVEVKGMDSKVSYCYANINDCPETETCDTIIGSSRTLYCYDYPKPGESGATYNFNMKWTFDKDAPNEEVVEGLWSGDYDDVVEFSHLFPEWGIHTVDLEVAYLPS